MAILTLIRCPRRASLIKLGFWRILARLLRKNEASEIHHGGRKVRGWRTSLPFLRAGGHIVTEAKRCGFDVPKADIWRAEVYLTKAESYKSAGCFSIPSPIAILSPNSLGSSDLLFDFHLA